MCGGAMHGFTHETATGQTPGVISRLERRALVRVMRSFLIEPTAHLPASGMS
jgi:hypothetical protein